MIFDDDKKTLRSAEKTRNSTCYFADLIASKCISKYKSICEQNELINGTGNTVIAGIHIENVECNSEPKLVALACGTKHCSKNPGIKDLHAEILVRRAFNRYIADQLLTNSNEKEHLGKLKVHFYISSAPCGNACIRRWAKPKKETWIDCPGLPEDKHSILHGFATKEGQFALTVKKERVEIDINEEQIDKKHIKEHALPAGILPYKLYPNLILSCSDKILIWNCVGLIKIDFLNWLPKIFISSLTVGRKFVRPHLSRAVCCRLGSKFQNVNHPVLLCSSVKLDEGGLDVDEGAKFDETNFVFCWSEGRDIEILNCKNGLRHPDNNLSFYSTQLIMNDLIKSLPSDGSDVINESKNFKRFLKFYLITLS